MISFQPFEQVYGGFLGKGESLEAVSKHLVSDIVEVDQVHGDQVWIVDQEADIPKVQGTKGDAIICALPNVGVAVRTADCVPILLAHSSGIVAAVHAGWRGTQAQILRKTIEKLSGEFQLHTDGLKISIGPSICLSCYEVGEEVAEQFPNDPLSKQVASAAGKYFLDLKRMNLQQALSLDIPPEHIETRQECTFCQSSSFHSHRKRLSEGNSNSGRNYSWIANKKEVFL